MDRKGASKLVNTVLLIAFVIALLIIVFLWGKGYMEELAQKRGLIAKKELECQDVELFFYDFIQTGPGNLSIILENKGKKDVHKLMFRIIGEKKVQPIEISGGDAFLGKSQIRKYDGLIFVESDIGKLEKVEAIPWLKVTISKYIPCTDKKIAREINPKI